MMHHLDQVVHIRLLVTSLAPLVRVALGREQGRAHHESQIQRCRHRAWKSLVLRPLTESADFHAHFRQFGIQPRLACVHGIEA